jgi:hypothetical protein
MSWVDALRRTGAVLRFREGASEAQLDALERRLGGPIPGDLRALLLESDGFDDVEGQWQVAWSCDRIAEETERVRADGLLGEDFLCFGDDGTGDPFCISHQDGGPVCHLSLIGGELAVLAHLLPAFWDGWFRGVITT